jgi:GNAT superfamily N-acetyltransferase
LSEDAAFSIRTAGPNDREYIAGLAARFAESELPPWRSYEEIAGGTRRQLIEALERGNDDRSALLIAESGGVSAGFAWVLLIADFYGGDPVGKVSEIAVTRSGGGAGRALMEACERWAAERGAKLMTLIALENNVRAREFYRRLGYAPEYTMFAKRL